MGSVGNAGSANPCTQESLPVAVTIVLTSFQKELRLTGLGSEMDISTRLLLYVTTAISEYLGATAYASTPDDVANQAAILLGQYIYDRPTASAGVRFANVFRNSGAAYVLAPYRSHNGGLTNGA